MITKGYSDIQKPGSPMFYAGFASPVSMSPDSVRCVISGSLSFISLIHTYMTRLSHAFYRNVHHRRLSD